MAYDLAGLGRLDGATALLRIAVELHPKEANLYDSLGELELKAGRREASVAAYKKALEIDPKFESSIKALEAIQRKER
jgi:predicted TPR repeat methyltransferase